MKHLCVVLFILTIAPLYGQKHRVWLDLSNGPSLGNWDLLAAGPGISVGWLTTNDRVLKIKTAYHHSIDILVNFPQQTGEVNMMTGIVTHREKSTFEFYYGLGLLGGNRHGDREGDSSHGFFVDLTTDYEKIQFITVGIPLEARLQGRIFGIGADAHLNWHLPYLGLKVFTRIGLAKAK